jgi:hypothetical protein
MTRPLPSLDTIVRRLALVEARLADLEGPYAETMYRLHRKVTGLDITIGRMANAAGVAVATNADIDAALDKEA